MTLWLRPEQARAIVEHARNGMPNEVCGLLLGRGIEVVEVVATKNVDPEPRTGFVVAPQDLFDALTRAEREGLSLVGAYHSHPNGHPIPSERDIAEAYYPDAAQLIVGLRGRSPELSAWRIEDGRISRLELRIQSNRPLPAQIEPQGLTPAQRLAVIAAGLIAVAIVLAVAYALLPPPELPT